MFRRDFPNRQNPNSPNKLGNPNNRNSPESGPNPDRHSQNHNPSYNHDQTSRPNCDPAPSSMPTLDDIASVLAAYTSGAAQYFAVICDDSAQAREFTQRSMLAGAQVLSVLPKKAQKYVVAQRFFSIEAVQKTAREEGADGDTTGRNLLALLCEDNPPTLILGIGSQGQQLLIELRQAARELYPDRASKFVTQTELEREAADRPFAANPDAFLLVAFERLYNVRID